MNTQTQTQPNTQAPATHANGFRLLLAIRSFSNESNSKGMEGCLADDSGRVVCYFPDKRTIVAYSELLAAAPDLLAALEALVSDEDSFAEFDHNLYRDRMTKARAAISRAKGQA